MSEPTTDLIARIEPIQRAGDLRPGLAARLLDPLWLLGRQWMLGEFDGEDAGTPVSVDYTLGHYPISRVRAGNVEIKVDNLGTPLERAIESLPSGRKHWTLQRRVETGALLAQLLCDAGYADAARSLLDAFSLGKDTDPDDQDDTPAARLTALTRGRVVDGEAVREALLGGVLPGALRAPAIEAEIAAWNALVTDMIEPPAVEAWQSERLEYAAEIDCDGLSSPLRVSEHHGDGLRWASVDMTKAPTAPPPKTVTLQRTPTALRFRGMPQARYWECEDATIDLGAVDAPAAELGRTAMLQMAMVYGNDVFLAPANVPLGTLAGVTAFSVSDTFGDMLGPTALTAATRTGAEPGRGWALWAPQCAGAPMPWLFFPPALAAPLIGEAVDDALLARDEMANRVWAIARLLEGEDGRSRAPAVNASSDTTTATSAEDDADYRYRMANDAPSGWVPLSLRVAADGRRLVRERNAATDTLLTRLLPEGAAVCDEEVGRDGVSLRIENVYARGSDGVTVVWTRVRRSPGRGGAASGLRFDQALPIKKP